jgi:hypothetical protein
MRDLAARLRIGVLATALAVPALADEPRPAPAATAGATATVPVEAPAATVPVEALAAAVAAWLRAEFGIDAPRRLPRIAFAEPEGLAALYRRRGDGAHGAGAPGRAGVLALYDQRRETILLPAGWTAASPAEVSILVHEMMHHLQHTARQPYGCAVEREAQAYEAQGRWLALFGEELEGALGIDPLFLRLLRVCGF